MTRLYLVRHCEARGNADRVFQGSTDAEISERGALQLERLRERFAAVTLDVLYSSPLRRAQATAQAINHQGLPVIIDQGLVEINGGHWEGVKWSEFPVRYPDEAHDWNLAPWNFAPVNGEPMRHVYDRISRIITAIVQREQGKIIGIVSHGCAIRNYLCFAHGWPIERLNDVDWADNTGVCVIDYDDTLHPQIIMENDNTHLTQELSTFATQEWWRKRNREDMKFD